VETAKQVGLRKNSQTKILMIRAKQAHENGIQFYLGNENIWLADFIPANYIDLISRLE
jgi:putative RNA 2'-phosphotransferase